MIQAKDIISEEANVTKDSNQQNNGEIEDYYKVNARLENALDENEDNKENEDETYKENDDHNLNNSRNNKIGDISKGHDLDMNKGEKIKGDTFNSTDESSLDVKKERNKSILALKVNSKDSFQLGDKDEKVIDLKLDLEKLGFKVSNNPTTYYGPKTEQKVREFQEYYGIKDDERGVAGKTTLSKIAEILSSPFQEGHNHRDTVKLKENLSQLGYHVSDNPTTYYGSKTARQVKAFQRDYGLVESGIAEPITWSKIEELINSPLKKGLYRKDVIDLKEKLEKFDLKVSDNPTNYFGSITEQKVKEFQAYYNLDVTGIADEETLAKIDEELSKLLRNPTNSLRVIKLKKDLEKLGFKVSDNPTDYFGPTTESKVKEFQKAYGLTVDGIVGPKTLSKIEELLSRSENIKYTTYNITFKKFVDIQMNVNPQTDLYPSVAYVSKDYIKNGKVSLNDPNSSLNVRSEPKIGNNIIGSLKHGQSVTITGSNGNWYEIRYGSTWKSAKRTDVEKYANPNNHDRFQHLVLSKSVGVSASELNKVLKGKGILEGKGSSFIEAGKKHGINEIYLISHALLETGNGNSTLAKGVVVDTVDGKKVTPKKVYNMFGIGAYDGCAVSCGAEYAYKQGWTSPEKAIIGGAAWIGRGYINAGQDTLYKMRWNPANPGTHQYATDIAWAVKQVSRIKSLYNQLSNPILHFNIPRFK